MRDKLKSGTRDLPDRRTGQNRSNGLSCVLALFLVSMIHTVGYVGEENDTRKHLLLVSLNLEQFNARPSKSWLRQCISRVAKVKAFTRVSTQTKPGKSPTQTTAQSRASIEHFSFTFQCTLRCYYCAPFMCSSIDTAVPM